MPRKTYPLEYRQRLVELVRAGQSPEQLARDYEPNAKTIREWAARAETVERGGLTEVDKDRRIRELERQLEIEREEKEILKKAAAWFARESASIPKRGSRS